MSTINSVTAPDTVTFGTAFTATISYASTGPTRVDVTPLSHLSVDPSEFEVDATGSSASVQLTLTDGNSPSTTAIVLLQFSLGASQFTVAATASPKV